MNGPAQCRHMTRAASFTSAPSQPCSVFPQEQGSYPRATEGLEEGHTVVTATYVLLSFLACLMVSRPQHWDLPLASPPLSLPAVTAHREPWAFANHSSLLQEIKPDTKWCWSPELSAVPKLLPLPLSPMTAQTPFLRGGVRKSALVFFL